MDNFTYSFCATRGVQANQVFYQATVPFRVLASMLQIDDGHDQMQRSQRDVNKARAKKVTQYIHKNMSSFYVIPPLVGFIQGECEFKEVPLDGFSNMGHLHLPIESRIMLFDGQTRAFGIRELMALEPDARHENICIMLYPYLTLQKRQQGFHDINFNSSKPSNALCITYNGRDPFDRVITDAVNKSCLAGYIEFQKNNVTGNSEKVWSMKAVKDLATNLYAGQTKDASEEFLTEFLNEITESVGTLRRLRYPASEPKEYREVYLCGHSVMASALGLLGYKLLSRTPTNWKEKLANLSDRSIWVRDSGTFEKRCELNGRLQCNKTAVKLTAYQLMRICDLELDCMEKTEETSLFKILENKLAA